MTYDKLHIAYRILHIIHTFHFHQQWTMFFKDPSNNALEFKAMADPDFLFARYDVGSH